MNWYPSEPQELAMQHLRNDRAALFMGCGLGKTSVVLHSLYNLVLDGATDGALVVAPLRVCNLTWPSEVRKWATLKGLKVSNLRTKQGMADYIAKKSNIYTCNYEMLPKLRDTLFKNRRVGTLGFDTIIWDELTKAKNHESRRINSVRPLFQKHCKRHWGLTGTPAPNGLLDLFAQIRLLDDGERLGKSFCHFRDTYFKSDYMGYNITPLPGAKEQIYSRLAGFALTLKSSDWLDIPDVVEEDVEVALPQLVRDQYKELEKELLLELDKTTIVAANAAVLVNKLLQLTSGAVYDLERNVHVLHDVKLAALKALVKQTKGPVLVGCSFRHEQDRIQAAFPQAVRFDSAKTDTAQISLAEAWNARKVPMLIANPQSIGHGLNLQGGGSTLVWFSTPWSRELYDQMNARLARRGQEQVTTIYRIVTTGTMDEVVIEALRTKDEEQTALLNALREWRASKCL